MASDATFDNQLQALATATANFANGKDAAIKNTIITALGGYTQQGGGASAAKIEPTLSVGSFSVNTIRRNETDICTTYFSSITYDGDGVLYANIHSPFIPQVGAMVNGNVLKVFVSRTVDDLPDSISGTLYATEGLTYAAKSLDFVIYNDEED